MIFHRQLVAVGLAAVFSLSSAPGVQAQVQAAVDKIGDVCQVTGEQEFNLIIGDVPRIGNPNLTIILGFRPQSDLLMIYFSFITAAQPTSLGACQLYLDADSVMQGNFGGMIGPIQPGPDGTFIKCPVPNNPALIGMFVELQASAAQRTGPTMTSEAYRLTFGV
ncbi:MAG: hypothetical protein ACYTG5_09905 [Planctomycetota bacterium]|jgi:hypothetical protein